MHVFYTPDILTKPELPEEEAQHCTRVLRLGIGDEITLRMVKAISTVQKSLRRLISVV
jgi:16S rRNA (uracil1498-N3)-methyltransferase